jgi:quercetin dioxygenase-like cupin family protein
VAGDSTYKQPDIEHGAVCLEAGVLLDIFTPCRQDFL